MTNIAYERRVDLDSVASMLEALVDVTGQPVVVSINDVGAWAVVADEEHIWGTGPTLVDAFHHAILATLGCPECGEDVFGEPDGTWWHTQSLAPLCALPRGEGGHA